MGKKNRLSELKSFNPHAVQASKNGKKTKSKDKGETANLLDQMSNILINPVLEKFDEWQTKMILELRESAIHTSSKSSKK